MDLLWPKSAAEVERIQRERRRVAVERARQSSFLKKRIPAGAAEDIWHKIPLLTKEELRQIPPERFHDEFCIQPRSAAVEYWRSAAPPAVLSSTRARPRTRNGAYAHSSGPGR